MTAASGQETVEVVDPILTVTTTIVSGASYSTTITTGSDSTATFEYVYPASSGLAYGAYNNPYNMNANDDWRSAFEANPQYFNTDQNQMQTCGIARNTNFDSTISTDDGPPYYGNLPGQSTTTDVDTIALVYHGYFVAPQTGSYTFSTTSDDFGYFWIGSKPAYSSWTNENVFANQDSEEGGRIDFAEGDVIPFTLLYANAGGGAHARFQVTLPDGTAVEGMTDLYIQPLDRDVWSPTADTACPLGVTGSACNEGCWNQFYVGTGYTLTPSTEGVSQQAMSNFYAPGTTQQQAYADCSAEGSSSGYDTIDLHYVTSDDVSKEGWECVLYPGQGNDPSQYSTANASISRAYGYYL